MKKLLKLALPIVLSILPLWGAEKTETQPEVSSVTSSSIPINPKHVDPDLDKNLQNLSVSIHVGKQENEQQVQEPEILPSENLLSSESSDERRIKEIRIELESSMLDLSKKYNELKKSESEELSAGNYFIELYNKDTSKEYVDEYVNRYTKDMRKVLTDESEEEYREEIAPRINSKFIQMGAFNSGARAKALQDALSNQRVKLSRSIAAMEIKAKNQAIRLYNSHKERELEVGKKHLQNVAYIRLEKEKVTNDYAELLTLLDKLNKIVLINVSNA